VVPRSWAIIWLAQAHTDVPSETPTEWRERWAEPARSFGRAPLPEAFVDPPGSVSPDPRPLVTANRGRAEAVLATTRHLLASD
jgi:hypothetical protein